jgi:hypothetical protein
MDRPITFQRTGLTTLTNHETGVTVEHVYTDGRNYYEVRRPALDDRGYSRVTTSQYLAIARNHAKAYVVPDYRQRIAGAYAEAAAEDVRRAERTLTGAMGAGIVKGVLALRLKGHVLEALRLLVVDDPDRACAWAKMVADAVADAKAGRNREEDTLGWVGRVRDYRVATGCGLREAVDGVKGQDEALAYLYAALTTADVQRIVSALADAAYLSTEYCRARQLRSHEVAVNVGEAAIAKNLDADQLSRLLTARAWARQAVDGHVDADEPDPDAVVQVGDLHAPAERVDQVRARLREGRVDAGYATRVLVNELGVTFVGAAALLAAESTAELAGGEASA